MNNDEISRRSPYRRGASDGITLGLLLTGIFLASVLSVRFSLLALVAIAGAVAVPFMIYRYLRRSYVADLGTTLISSLWMQGIMAFACAAAISGLVAMVYLKWIDPYFMSERIAEAIELYRNSGLESGERTADTLQAMVDGHMMPSSVEFVLEAIWLTIFSGSMLSLLMALLARARAVGNRRS